MLFLKNDWRTALPFAAAFLWKIAGGKSKRPDLEVTRWVCSPTTFPPLPLKPVLGRPPNQAEAGGSWNVACPEPLRAALINSTRGFERVTVGPGSP